MEEENSGGARAPGSTIPSLRPLTQADESILDQLYGKMYPGCRTNLSVSANSLGMIVERNGRISAAAVGGYATIGYVVLVVDPDAEKLPEVAHDAIAALDAVSAAIRQQVAPGALMGQVVLVSKRPGALGETLDRAGWFRENENLSAHISIFVNDPPGPPPARS